MNEYVTATYEIESFLPLEQAAEALAGEQTTGTFTAVPGETAEIRDRYGAAIRSLDLLVHEPPYPHSWLPGSTRPEGRPSSRGRLVVDYPIDNIGHSFSNVLAGVAGNLFELRQLAGVRLIDLDFPPSFVAAHPGPRHGSAGTRAALGGRSGPLIGTIVKPSVGLAPDELADLVGGLAAAGIDFIKDDELMNDPPYSPFIDRVQTVQSALRANQDDSNHHQVMFAFNVTGDVEDMLERLQIIEDAGGTCAMVVVTAIGISTLELLRRRTDLVLHVHRAGFGALSRQPNLGIDFLPYQKMVRMAGADHFHTNGFGNKFYESDDDIERSIRSVMEPIGTAADTLPVLSSGQSAATVAETWRRIRSHDLLMLAGGGILGHRGGLAAGVESMREAWNASMAGTPVHVAAEDKPSLRDALTQFGSHGG